MSPTARNVPAQHAENNSTAKGIGSATDEFVSGQGVHADGTAAGVADDGRIALGKAGVLAGVEPGVRASENGEGARRRQGKFCFVSKVSGVSSIGLEHSGEDLIHRNLFLPGDRADIGFPNSL